MEMKEKKKFSVWESVLSCYKKNERRKNKLIKWEIKREEGLLNGECLPLKPPKPKSLRPKRKRVRRVKKKKKRIIRKVKRVRKKKIKRQPKYAIHLTTNESKSRCIGRYNTLGDMSYALDCYKKKHRDVVIPNEYKKVRRLAVPIKRELVISRIKRGDENKVTYLNNDMGKLCPYTTPDDSKYIILSKTPIIFENWYKLWNDKHKGTFVTFMDIWNDLILLGLNNKFTFRRITIFKNKILIERDDNVDVIKCRCISESVKLYNKIMEFKIKQHKHNVLPGVKIFEGKHKLHTYYRDIIMSITGWSQWKTKYPMS